VDIGHDELTDLCRYGGTALFFGSIDLLSPTSPGCKFSINNKHLSSTLQLDGTALSSGVSMKKIVLMITSIALLSGCETFKETMHPTVGGMQKRTADELGFDVSKVKVSNLHDNGSGMHFWIADTPKGRYSCNMDSGVMMALNSAGQTVNITCHKQ
jgi:hypothetical protein